MGRSIGEKYNVETTSWDWPKGMGDAEDQHKMIEAVRSVLRAYNKPMNAYEVFDVMRYWSQERRSVLPEAYRRAKLMDWILACVERALRSVADEKFHRKEVDGGYATGWRFRGEPKSVQCRVVFRLAELWYDSTGSLRDDFYTLLREAVLRLNPEQLRWYITNIAHVQPSDVPPSPGEVSPPQAVLQQALLGWIRETSSIPVSYAPEDMRFRSRHDLI